MRHDIARATRVLLLLLVGSAAGASDLNPGRMGPNAMPPQPSEAPWVDSTWMVELGVAAQQAMGPLGGRDFSFISPFRLSLPFGTRAALFAEGTPFEAWTVSSTTRGEWQVPDRAEFTKGDIRIGGKFFIVDGAPRLPAVALRGLIKTTSGKGAEDRRFINAPGYLFELLIGQRFPLDSRFAFELWLSAGFLVWQQGGDGQNDAPSGAGTVWARWTEGPQLRFDVRGYRGWQQDDKPIVASAGAELPVSPGFSVTLTVAHGFRDPVMSEARVGMKFVPPRR